MRDLIARSLLCLICLCISAGPARQVCLGQQQPSTWKSMYDMAVELHNRDDDEGSKRLQEEVRRHPLQLRIAVNVILVNDEFLRNTDLFTATPEEQGSRILIDVAPEEHSILGKKVVEAIVREDLRAMELLEASDCKDAHLNVVASSFVRLLDTQQAELKLIPDRVFRPLGRSDQGAAASAPAAPDSHAITILFRPVVSPDGKRIRIDLFDHANSLHVFPPRSLACTVAWVFPGLPDAALGPPMLDHDDKAVKFANRMEVHDGGYFLLSRITAMGERETTNTVPVLGKVPLLKRLLTSRKLEKEHAHLFVLFRPLIEDAAPRR